LKFALALNRDEIASHFGHCEKFLVIDAKDGKEIKREVVENPGHEPGLLPRLLNDADIDCLIAGGIGNRAQNLFSNFDIDVIPGIQGEADNVIDAFLSGTLKPGDNLCEH